MAESDELIIEREEIDDAVVIKAHGEIDLIRSPQLRTKLMELLDDDVQRLVIDLSDVPFMDSSGVATLVEALQVQRKKGLKLVLTGLQSRVKSIFEISRLDMVFQITEDVDTAVKLE